MARREYSDEDKATALAALDANGGNVQRTARTLGIPEPTLRGWARKRGIHPTVVELHDQKKGSLADELEEIAEKLAGAMPGKVAEASLQQTATSLGIVIDKMQLLRGQPTNITDDASLTDAERATRIVRLLDAARTRRDGPVASEPGDDSAGGVA